MTTETGLISWSQLRLPLSLVSQSDLTRLIRELEGLSNAFVTNNVRGQTGLAVESKFVISEPMQDFIETNQLNLSERTARDNTLKQLRILKNHAPIIHITFAAPVGNDDIVKLIQWFRQEIHSQTVLTIGLQPGLIGGAYIRTSNHVFDFSIKSQLEGHSDIIEEALETLSGGS